MIHYTTIIVMILIICTMLIIYVYVKPCSNKKLFTNTTVQKILIVTAMYNIAGKHSTDSYKKYLSNWFPYFENGNMVIFCDDYYYDYIKELRKNVMNKTTIIKKPIEEFKVYKEFNDFFKNNNEKIKNVYNIDYRKQLIWGEKINFMYEGYKIYPQAEYIAWFDGGYFREDQDKDLVKTLFSDLSKINPNKTYMIRITSDYWIDVFNKNINDKKPGQFLSDYKIDYNSAYLAGGFILTHSMNIKKIYDLFYLYLSEFKKADKEFLDDQYIFAFMVLDNKYKDMFELLLAPSQYEKDVWFYAKDYFNKVIDYFTNFFN